MNIPSAGTFQQRIMPCNVSQMIQQVHWEQGPEIMALLLQDMYIWLGFSPNAAKLLIRKQGLDSSERLRVLTNKNVHDICNVMRKLGGKNVNGMPNRGQHVSVIDQENLKLATFLFYHRLRCTLDWEVTGVYKDTVCLLVGKRNLWKSTKTPMCCLIWINLM